MKLSVNVDDCSDKIENDKEEEYCDIMAKSHHRAVRKPAIARQRLGNTQAISMQQMVNDYDYEQNI
jgi:hypothetical protein